jgi:hypothetical protein
VVPPGGTPGGTPGVVPPVLHCINSKQMPLHFISYT